MPTRKGKRSVSALRGKAKSTVQRIESELPAELRPYTRRVRQLLRRLEKAIGPRSVAAPRRLRSRRRAVSSGA